MMQSDRHNSRNNILRNVAIFIATITVLALIFLGIQMFMARSSAAQAVQIEHTFSCDHIFASFTKAYIDFDDTQPVTYYLQKPSDVCLYPSLVITVTNRSAIEEVLLPPYLLMEMEDVQPITSSMTINAITLYSGFSSGQNIEFPDEFVGILSPDQERLFGAPLSIYDTSDLTPDSPVFELRRQSRIINEVGKFKLQPQQSEVFRLRIDEVPGYYYHFKVGVVYKYKGQQYNKWITESFPAFGTPDRYKMWQYFAADEFDESTGFVQHTELGPENHQQQREILKEHLQKAKERVAAIPSFRFP